MDDPPADRTSRFQSSKPSPPRPPGLPDLPGYRLLDRLGGGGMGEVYLAEDEVLGRQVAVKAIAPAGGGWDEGESRERLVREARAMASLSHPNLVQVHTLARHEGRDFLIMELVRGGTLEDRIRREGPLPLPEALALLRQVSDALAAAWERGIIHRDVKPANILLDERGTAKVADFGLAKPVEDETSLRLTRTGTVMGTPCYMSPEQAGEGEMSFRSDIYSLGLVYYEMVSGRPPFEKMGYLTVVTRHIAGDLPDLAIACPGLPDRAVHLYRWMTRRDPAQRPPSYAALHQEIDAALASLREPERRPAAESSGEAVRPAGPRPARSRQTSPRALIWGWIGVLALGAIAGTTWFVLKEKPEPAETEPTPVPPEATPGVSLTPGPPVAGPGRKNVLPRPLPLEEHTGPDTPAGSLAGILRGLATGAFNLRLGPAAGDARRLEARAGREAGFVLFVLREDGDLLLLYPPADDPETPFPPESPLAVDLPDRAAPGWAVLLATPRPLTQPIVLGARPDVDSTIYPRQIGTREPAHPAFNYLSWIVSTLRASPDDWDLAIRPL